MKSYTFEYTRQGFTYLLFGVSVAILGLGLWLFRTLFGNTLPAGLVVVLIIGSSVAFFLLNKHRIRKTGTATISVDELTIALNQTVHVPFNGLKYYYIYFGKNGTVFTLGFLDGKKIKITANNNFCNDELLKAFVSDFQVAIENYKAQNQINIIRLESVFARKQTLYILSLFTVLVILGFGFTSMPVMILPISVSVSLLFGWISYFQQKRKGNLVDF